MFGGLHSVSVRIVAVAVVAVVAVAVALVAAPQALNFSLIQSHQRPAMELLEPPPFVRHRLTVHDYHRMAQAEVLAPGARVELIEGEVIDMAPMGTRHRAAVMRLSQLLHDAVGHAAHVSTQLPLRLDAHSEPEPDLALLKPRDDFYADTLPSGADTWLVIEVSDTTLAYDTRIKAPLYARGGVPELWVLDLAGHQLHRYARPMGGAGPGYGEHTVLDKTSPLTLALPGLPGRTIDLSDLL